MNSFKSKNGSNLYYIVNIITLSRLIAALLIFCVPNTTLFITIWIGLSDFLDGFLARKWNVTTLKGELLDQYIDKLATIIVLYFFLKEEKISLLFVALIIVREIVIIILRRLRKISLSSNLLGKSKTFLLYLLFILLAINQHNSTFIINVRIVLEYSIIVFSFSSLLVSFKK